jgi:hypothetical protein
MISRKEYNEVASKLLDDLHDLNAKYKGLTTCSHIAFAYIYYGTLTALCAFESPEDIQFILTKAVESAQKDFRERIYEK